eukprot:PhM_4_TR8243/c0_g1_i1/m.102168
MSSHMRVHPNTQDGLYAVTDAIDAMSQNMFGSTPVHPAKPLRMETDRWDKSVRGYHGDEGMLYYVPVSTQIPSEFHCQKKSRNIRILLDNVYNLSSNGMLPQTEEEREFWAAYPKLKTQLFMTPFGFSFPFTYLGLRYLQPRLTMHYKGRSWSVFLSLMFAEQVYERYFPSHQLLSTALSARTPLGDAARAEWQRLQPHAIGSRDWLNYVWHRTFGNNMGEFEFGAKYVPK